MGSSDSDRVLRVHEGGGAPRRSLEPVILRELAMFGPQGLTPGPAACLATSPLGARRPALESWKRSASSPATVELAIGAVLPRPAGEQFLPTLRSFWAWAEHWIPEDPVTAQRDPTVILWWLRHRIDVRALPDRPVVIEFSLPLDDADRQWLLLAAGAEPELCHETR